MLRVLMTRTGVPAPEAIDVVEAEVPRPGPGEALVRVLARPINPADLLLLEGRHMFAPTLPGPVGIEGAGVVEAIGEGSLLPVGARVAIPFGGTWTEQMVFASAELIPLPDTLSIEQGAMLSVNPFTAAGLLEGLAPGDAVVLDAATSAMGKMIVKLCARRGLRAVGVVRSAEAVPGVEAAGAVAALVDGPDLAVRVQEVLGGGAKRALDAVAGEASGRLFGAVAEGGTLVVYGLLASDSVVLPAAQLVFRDVTVTGFSRLRGLKALSPERRSAIAAELATLAADGVLDAEVEARYPLGEVRAALAHHGRPGRRGKILLVS